VYDRCMPIKRWSFSALTIFERCPFWAKLKYEDRVPEPEFARGAAAVRGSQAHDNAERFVKGEVKLANELQSFAPEFDRLRELYAEGAISLESTLAFDQSWGRVADRSSSLWVKMVLDTRVELAPATRLVVDYKTGKKDGNEVKHAEQGQLYMVGEFAADPKLDTVWVEFWYLDLNVLTKVRYSREHYEAHKASFHRRGSNMTSATFFPPAPSKRNCRWCPYRSSRTGGTGHCAYAKD
jgi:RecB family exonuclease